LTLIPLRHISLPAGQRQKIIIGNEMDTPKTASMRQTGSETQLF